MEIKVDQLTEQNKIERELPKVSSSVEISDFNKMPFQDRIFGRLLVLCKRQDESDEDFKKRVSENTLDTNFYYDQMSKSQQTAINKSTKKLIQRLSSCGMDARALKKQYRKTGLIKGKFN